MGKVLALAALLLASVANGQAQSQASADFPAGWQVQQVEEPIFGSRMRVVLAGRMTGTPLLLVHGLGNAGVQDWRATIPALERDYRVIAFDLPGFAASDSRGGLYTPRNYARLLNWLHHRYLRRPARVVGHSMGGAIALRYALDFRANVDTLVLVDAAGMLQRSVFVHEMTRAVTAQGAAGSAWYGDLAGTVNAWITSLLDTSEEWLPDASAYIVNNPTARRYLLNNNSSVTSAMALVDEDFSAAHALALPVHLIWGERDPVAPLRIGETLAHVLPRAQLHVLADLGHSPMHEDPARFNALLRRVLRRAPIAANLPGVQVRRDREVSCRDRRNVVYRGAFQRLVIEDCSNVLIRDAFIGTLVVRHSEVTLNSVRIEAPAGGLRVEDARLRATGLAIRAARAIEVRDSRLDIAAAVIDSPEPVRMDRGSVVYFSLSRSVQPHGVRYWHGMYTHERL